MRRYRHEEFLRIGMNDIHGKMKQPEVALQLTEVEPGDASVVLPPLVTVIGRRLASRGAESQGLASRGAEATSRCR